MRSGATLPEATDLDAPSVRLDSPARHPSGTNRSTVNTQKKTTGPAGRSDEIGDPVYEISAPGWCAVKPEHEVPDDHRGRTSREPDEAVT